MTEGGIVTDAIRQHAEAICVELLAMNTRQRIAACREVIKIMRRADVILLALGGRT